MNSTKYYELEYNYSVVHVVGLKIKRNVGVIFGSIFQNPVTFNLMNFLLEYFQLIYAFYYCDCSIRAY